MKKCFSTQVSKILEFIQFSEKWTLCLFNGWREYPRLWPHYRTTSRCLPPQKRMTRGHRTEATRTFSNNFYRGSSRPRVLTDHPAGWTYIFYDTCIINQNIFTIFGTTKFGRVRRLSSPPRRELVLMPSRLSAKAEREYLFTSSRRGVRSGPSGERRRDIPRVPPFCGECSRSYRIST
jgi:hypothetical protein